MTYAKFTSSNGWEEIIRQDSFTILAISEVFEIRNLIDIQEEDLSGHFVKLKINSENIFAIGDSGSPMSFLYEKTAGTLLQKDRSAI